MFCCIIILEVMTMTPSIYYELQAAAERLSPIEEGPAWEALNRMQNELDALLPPILHRRFRRLCDQANAAAAEYGEGCFINGMRCGLLLMADACELK